MTRSAPDHPAGDPAGTSLRRGAIGVIGILFFVLSAQAPLTGIAGALPVAIVLGNGSGAPGAYLVVGAVICLFAVGFITMSRHVTDAGAFYSYISRGLGRPTGTGAAVLALVSYNTIQAAMYGLYGVTCAFLAETYLGLTTPWWVWAIGTMILIQVLGSLNIEMGARFLAVLVVGEMSILLAFAVATLVGGGGPEGLDPAGSFAPSALLSGAPGVALTFAVASMFGFESTAIYAAEAKDPTRTVPRATYLSVAVISLFFAFISWMLVSSYGATAVAGAAGAALEGGDGTILLFDAIAAALGGWTVHALGILLATSLLAGILAFHNASNRYVHSLVLGGDLPLALARTNRHGAPYVASTLQTVVALALVTPFALAGADPVLTLFSWFSGLAVLALVVLYFLTSVSVVVYFRRTRLDTRVWNTLVAPTAAAVLIVAGTGLLLSNFTTLIGGSAAMALPLVLSVPAAFAIGVLLDVLRARKAQASAADLTSPAIPAPRETVATVPTDS